MSSSMMLSATSREHAKSFCHPRLTHFPSTPDEIAATATQRPFFFLSEGIPLLTKNNVKAYAIEHNMKVFNIKNPTHEQNEATTVLISKKRTDIVNMGTTLYRNSFVNDTKDLVYDEHGHKISHIDHLQQLQKSPVMNLEKAKICCQAIVRKFANTTFKNNFHKDCAKKIKEKLGIDFIQDMTPHQESFIMILLDKSSAVTAKKMFQKSGRNNCDIGIWYSANDIARNKDLLGPKKGRREDDSLNNIGNLEWMSGYCPQTAMILAHAKLGMTSEPKRKYQYDHFAETGGRAKNPRKCNGTDQSRENTNSQGAVQTLEIFLAPPKMESGAVSMNSESSNTTEEESFSSFHSQTTPSIPKLNEHVIEYLTTNANHLNVEPSMVRLL